MISKIFGGATSTGFELEGGSALLLFGLVIAYFVGTKKFIGGTLGQKLLGVGKKKSK